MLINECAGVRHLAAGFVGARVDISIAQEVDNLLVHSSCDSMCVWWLHDSIHQEFVYMLINECAGVRHLAAGFVGARVDISIAQEVDNLLVIHDHPVTVCVCGGCMIRFIRSSCTC